MPKCAPCMGLEVKAAILKELPGLTPILKKVPNCPEPQGMDFCIGKHITRARSPYQSFISSCMKAKGIHGREEAAKAMRECAGQWKKEAK